MRVDYFLIKNNRSLNADKFSLFTFVCIILDNLNLNFNKLVTLSDRSALEETKKLLFIVQFEAKRRKKF